MKVEGDPLRSGDIPWIMNKLILLTWAMAALFFLSGCGTFLTVSSASLESPKIYSGTRLDYHAIAGNEDIVQARFKVRPPEYPLLDIPFSLALDTVVFPLTYPVALYETVFH